MPQLSPMSWVLVVSLVLVCLTFFMTVTWWWVTTKYSIKHPSKKKYAKHSKKNYFLSEGKSMKTGSSKV